MCSAHLKFHQNKFESMLHEQGLKLQLVLVTSAGS